MTSLQDDIRRLAAIPLKVDGDLQALLRALQERQGLIDRVQKADVSGLTPTQRKHLEGQVNQLLESTQTAATALQARQRDLKQRQGEMLAARQAARGYRPDLPAGKRSLRRNA